MYIINENLVIFNYQNSQTEWRIVDYTLIKNNE